MNRLTSLARIWLTRSFKPFKFTKECDEFLNYDHAKGLGLYVHVPFCRQLCSFCPYCKVIYNEEMAKEYVNSLLKEIKMVGDMYEGDKKEVTSLYFGGGTPSLIGDDIPLLIDRINEYYVITEGIGIELHPEDVTLENLIRLKEAGVTKICIGIQSFQKKCLRALGRGESNYDEMFHALEKVSFETVSMDFIFALPGQTSKSLLSDVEMAFSNHANHIAMYPFIDFSYTDRKFKGVSNREKKQLLYDTVNLCKAKGYSRDSIWTYSKNGIAKYSSMTRENFLGFGCSATTLLKDQFKINTFDIQEYMNQINNKKLATSLTIKFEKRQRMVYYMFWSLYTLKLNKHDFKDFFGEELKKCYGFELWVGKVLGLLRENDDEYVMTTRGSYYYHYFEYFYTYSYIDKMWSLMKDEAFPGELIIY